MEDQLLNPCHPERSPSDAGARTESKDPENLSPTMRRQGILTSTLANRVQTKKSLCRQHRKMGLTE